MRSATAKIASTINRRARRFLARGLKSGVDRRVRLDSTACFGADTEDEDSDAKKRSLQLRQRNASRPRARWKISFQRVLREERILELPHPGQIMISEELGFELIVLRAYPRCGASRGRADTQDVTG